VPLPVLPSLPPMTLGTQWYTVELVHSGTLCVDVLGMRLVRCNCTLSNVQDKLNHFPNLLYCGSEGMGSCCLRCTLQRRAICPCSFVAPCSCGLCRSSTQAGPTAGIAKTYTASAGGGAFCDGRPIQASTTPNVWLPRGPSPALWA